MAITASDIKALRDKTGVGMMECKKALTEANGDIEQAIVLLRERGIAAAAKKASRIAAEGMVYPFYCDQCGVAGIIEVNTETDFAAKNEKFADFVKGLSVMIAKEAPADVDALVKLAYLDSGLTVEQELNNMILTIGENIKIRRFVRYAAAANSVYAIYNHHMAGKVAVVTKLEVSDNLVGNDAVQAFGKDICMGVAANRPEFVSSDEVPAERLDSEREILKAQVMNEGKPAAVADKIVNGRLGKFYEEVCLVDQPYIRDMKISVKAQAAELQKQLGGEIKVVAFTRYECGEGLEKREDNFAEEVEKMMK
ncbi:MAG: elongation factor Ts [Clostridiales bacterium]|nr:MAG: elongation factor Ts [Clostridiales bacterium]